MPPLPAQKLTEADFQRYFQGWVLAELKNEGFPDWMIYAFVSTAKETKTILLSRTPGGAGLDLIDAGYDLKGFQIKAKSCSWGPMSGFICQLPFFNKAGAKKISYNTGNIFHYLKCLETFKGIKLKIDAINKKMDDTLSYLEYLDVDLVANAKSINEVCTILVEDFTTDPPKNEVRVILTSDQSLADKQAAIKKIVTKEFYQQIGTTTKKYKAEEQKSGEWSGENTIEGDSPFIHLKREVAGANAEVIATLKKMKGVNGNSVVEIGSNIYGIAQDDKASVLMEFLLHKESEDVWAIYHGDITFTISGGAATRYVPSFGNVPAYWNSLDEKTQKKYPITAAQDATDEVKLMYAHNRSSLDKVFSFASVPDAITATVPQTNGDFAAASRRFYPLQGFVNPHPPYKKNNNFFYKNAVSGDYDLFAFWPNNDIPGIELVRLSENYLNTLLKLFADTGLRFCIEFIPGFGELNPSDDKPLLKESAELGNISSLGSLVSGTLNAFSDVFFKTQFQKPALNKAFHSDEGGRPGILEIEFPIAVFFHRPVLTKALNNEYNQNAPLTPLKDRNAIETYGGLIKTPEELLEIIFDCQQGQTKYHILVQAEWMGHLVYISLPDAKRDEFVRQTGDYAEMFNTLNTTDSMGKPLPNDNDAINARKKSVNEKLDEFKAIEKNHGKIYSGNNVFDQPTFEKNLKTLLKLNSGLPADEAKFNKLREKFLEMPFQGGKKAALKKSEVEVILYDLN